MITIGDAIGEKLDQVINPEFRGAVKLLNGRNFIPSAELSVGPEVLASLTDRGFISPSGNGWKISKEKVYAFSYSQPKIKLRRNMMQNEEREESKRNPNEDKEQDCFSALVAEIAAMPEAPALSEQEAKEVLDQIATIVDDLNKSIAKLASLSEKLDASRDEVKMFFTTPGDRQGKIHVWCASSRFKSLVDVKYERMTRLWADDVIMKLKKHGVSLLKNMKKAIEQ